MPQVAHGMTKEEFFQMLAKYESTLPADKALDAWPKFVNWRHYGN